MHHTQAESSSDRAACAVRQLLSTRQLPTKRVRVHWGVIMMMMMSVAVAVCVCAVISVWHKTNTKK